MYYLDSRFFIVAQRWRQGGFLDDGTKQSTQEFSGLDKGKAPAGSDAQQGYD